MLKIWVKPEHPRELWQVFSKLRLVNLAAISEECDLTWTMFVLQGATSLEELCIRVCDCVAIWDEDLRKKLSYSEEEKDVGAKWEASYFKHRSLSVLRIFGFQSEDKFVDYVTTVMEREPENLMLGQSDFTKICSTCKRLEFLYLFNIDMEIPLLEVEHPQLRELELVKCSFERVDLNWLPKLATLTLTYWDCEHDPLSIGYVPLLHTVTMSHTAFSWHKMLKLSEVLGKSTVRELHLNFQSEKIWIKSEGPRELWPVLHNLRFVNLADISEECDLSWTLFILEGAPSLKELCLRVWNRCQMARDKEKRKQLQFSEEDKDAGVDWEASDFKHHNLAVLRIYGFQVGDKFLDYVQSVIDTAVNLKNIYLHERPTCVTCKHKKRKDRYPWAKKQRVSIVNSFDMGMHPLLRIHFPSIRS